MDEAQPLRELLGSIAAEFEVALGRPEKVAADCALLRERLARPPTASDVEALCQLGALLGRRGSPLALPVFELLEEQAAACADPWPLLDALLRSRDALLARRALAVCERLCDAGALSVDRAAARLLADRVEAPGSPLAEPEALTALLRMLRRAARGPQDPVQALYVEPGDLGVRRLAARLLDGEGRRLSVELGESLLGAEAHAFLAPYLRYTKATHLDLLQLLAAPGAEPPALVSLRRAEAACGEPLLRELIAALGWSRLNLGLELRPYVGVAFGGSLPLLVPAEVAPLLEACAGAHRTAEAWLAVAHGGQPASAEAPGSGVVGRFRAYNLAHAEALADILDVAPLTREKVERIVRRMDRIVEEFTAIFAPHAEECAILPGLYRELRGRVTAELERQGAPAQLSAELTRLVQSFEDPRSLGEVRTLHGLKRYLHQRGLRLGFRLVGAGGGTNRTLDLALAARGRVLRSLRKIAYVDFEPATALEIPHAVSLIAEGFARQLQHGHESFPSVQVFCYGNEVHYYLAYRNHPAFLRIDFAPPLLGGMIDLEYYGVSVYELSSHPGPSLDVLREFFRALEFYVRIDGTRVHARYDKERALTLGDLCDKAELLACLVPYLMDLDWIVGSLGYDSEARRQVGEAWARSFAEWGVLPVRQLLDRERQRVLAGVEAGPAGESEIAWSGAAPYRDRFLVPAPAGLRARLREALLALGLEETAIGPADAERLPGQLWLERHFLAPLRDAVAQGLLAAGPAALQRRPPDLFERRHEAEIFAELLASGDVRAALRLAGLVAPLERTLRFRATGRVNGHEVQRARLSLRGESIRLYALRDSSGIIRLAVFGRGDVLGRRREAASQPWQPNWSTDACELASLLRRNGYLAAGTEAADVGDAEVAEALALFRSRQPVRVARLLPGERVLYGVRAAGGRTVGRSIFGTTGRHPEDLDGAVLVAPAVRPEDNTFLYHARGVVSTGGGILSHAGLIATQFRKPALIVSGRWRTEKDGSLTLLFSTPEYQEQPGEVAGRPVVVFREWREVEHRLREGDLVVLDADAGVLHALGQERDALALHEELWRLGEAGRSLAHASEPLLVLSLRGQRLRAAYQLRKLLARLTDPVLARHAAHELLAGESLAGEAATRQDRAELLQELLGNPSVAEAARRGLLGLVAELQERHGAAVVEAGRRLPTATTTYEILARCLEAVRLRESLQEALASLDAVGVAQPMPPQPRDQEIDGLALDRLAELREERMAELAGLAAGQPRWRYLLRELDRLEQLLGAPSGPLLQRAAADLGRRDAARLETCRERLVIAAEDAGFETHPLVGWKAANLAEASRLAEGCRVPPFFVVTDRAFERVLDTPLARLAPGLEGVPPGAGSLREAIDALLVRGDLDNARKSARIQALWEAVRLPDALANEVIAAYRCLDASDDDAAQTDAEGPFVAIRSSARDEDAELAARAGEFETFLFVRGEERVLEHLKRAWSGLWTERAIHNRALAALGSQQAGGGVVVQRIVWSRVSGVLQTVNVAEQEPREMVVNVGLGLGEGIVSGQVAADHVVVAKQGDLARGPLRFRYVTADKREQVVFDSRAGFGTSRVECLYHQRLRPALEYVELCELVAVAARLERAYGHPLDLEFGIEGARLFVLQARPVPAYLASLSETLERRPLGAGRVVRELAEEGVHS